MAVELIWPLNPWREALYVAVLAAYVAAVIYASLPMYESLVSRGLSADSARYYVRKLIHIFAGGVAAILAPRLFSSPLPLLLAVFASAFTLLAASRLKPMHWFQAPDNVNEVSFTLAWGLSFFALWHVARDPFVAILPAAFMSFGDGVTGIVRNALFGARTKHWAGNLTMAAVCLPIGYVYAGLQGLVAAAAASLVEGLELRRLDDNALIALTSTLILACPPPLR